MSSPSQVSPVPPAAPPASPAASLPSAAAKPTANSTNQIVKAWIPLSSWCRDLSLSKPQLLRTNGQIRYEVSTPNGPLTLIMGQQMAYWNRAAFWMGYRPQLADGIPYIHVLDGIKTLRPLVLNPFLIRRGATIVLDPGHGGKDSGSKSILNGSHSYEKYYALDWALRMQKILATNGLKVILTRTNDMDLAISNRVAVAETNHADVFISLHFNSAYPSLDATGIETFSLTPPGMPSSLTRGFEDDPNLNCANNAHDTRNWQLALRVHHALLAKTGATDRAVRRARFPGVLRGQNRPAILVEGGFLSTPAEARKIADAAYRQQLSLAVSRAILQLVEKTNSQVLTQHE